MTTPNPPTRRKLSVDDHVSGILAGNRTALARAITLIESSHPAHSQDARDTIEKLMPHSGSAVRVGISGVPGVGKSTFIEVLGTMLTALGKSVAVLAVDPSSTRTGGSILGDKTRMQQLSMDPNAYVRPSPTSGTLGGVTRVTRESIVLCEAAGFDVIIVETVGVGQSEIAVAQMVDFFLLLMLPGAGDELQGIKKGVLESADLIAVNKADVGDSLAAQHAASAYRNALNVMEPLQPDWQVPVMTCSALTKTGIEEIWQSVLDYQTKMMKSGYWLQRRQTQQVRWMHDMVEGLLLSRLKADADRAARLKAIESAVREGSRSPVSAATEIVGLS